MHCRQPGNAVPADKARHKGCHRRPTRAGGSADTPSRHTVTRNLTAAGKAPALPIKRRKLLYSHLQLPSESDEGKPFDGCHVDYLDVILTLFPSPSTDLSQPPQVPFPRLLLLSFPRQALLCTAIPIIVSLLPNKAAIRRQMQTLTSQKSRKSRATVTRAA